MVLVARTTSTYGAASAGDAGGVTAQGMAVTSHDNGTASTVVFETASVA